MGVSPGLPTRDKRKGSTYSTWEALKFWVSPGKIMLQTHVLSRAGLLSMRSLLRQSRLR